MYLSTGSIMSHYLMNHIISLLIMIFISLVYASVGDLNVNMNDEDGDSILT